MLHGGSIKAPVMDTRHGNKLVLPIPRGGCKFGSKRRRYALSETVVRVSIAGMVTFEKDNYEQRI
jgi:hypothetical protein